MLIGLHGKARSGKTTTSNLLVRKHGFKEVAFADGLKKLCADLFDLSLEQLHGDLKEVVDSRYNMSPREIFQLVGTECMRKISPDIWIDKVKPFVVNHMDVIDIVISDVRFKNELDFIKTVGGHMVKVVRIDGPRLATQAVEHHKSEVDLDNVPDDQYSAVIQAESGDIEFIEKSIDRLVKEWINA